MARKFKTGGLRKIRNVSSLRHVCIHGPSSFLLLFYSALLFYLSTRPHHSLSFLPFILGSPFDKMFHFIEYGILGFLWVSWLRNFQWKLQGKKIWIVILICLVYSLIDEWVQSVIPRAQMLSPTYWDPQREFFSPECYGGNASLIIDRRQAFC